MSDTAYDSLKKNKDKMFFFMNTNWVEMCLFGLQTYFL